VGKKGSKMARLAGGRVAPPWNKCVHT